MRTATAFAAYMSAFGPAQADFLPVSYRNVEVHPLAWHHNAVVRTTGLDSRDWGR